MTKIELSEKFKSQLRKLKDEKLRDSVVFEISIYIKKINSNLSMVKKDGCARVSFKAFAKGDG